MKKHIYLLFGIAIFGINLAYAFDTNEICIYPNPYGENNEDVDATTSFQLNNSKSYSTTDGLFGGIQDEGTTCFNVIANRSNSAKNVLWVNQQLENEGVAANGQNAAVSRMRTPTSNPYPEELNFAIQGTLTLTDSNGTYTCPNIIIGQGHYPTVNNWWIFSNTDNYNRDSPMSWLYLTCNNGTTIVDILPYNSPYSNLFRFIAYNIKDHVGTANSSIN